MEHVAMTVEPEPPINGRRSSALFSLLVGAVVSLGLMLWVGRHDSSVELMLLFTVWVASPFAGMALVLRSAKRWPLVRQNVTYNQVRFISLGSALIYFSTVDVKQLAKPAGPFLAVPIASWLLMGLWLWMTNYFHGESSGETTVLNLNGKK
ncbi:MAG: hypothetical protein ABSD43_00075 [Terracidiphilus sp.]|jgi:hypothetical protein